MEALTSDTGLIVAKADLTATDDEVHIRIRASGLQD